MRPVSIPLLVLALMTSCGSPEADPPRPLELVVRLTDSPADGRSGQPRLGDGGDGRTRLSWIEERGAGHVLMFSTAEGDGWSRPLEVAAGDDWFVNWADVPSVTALANGTLAAHWLERTGEGTYAYGVRFSVSRDDGRRWDEPKWLHADRAPTEHGFASIVPLTTGRFSAAWLDGNALDARREMELRAVTFDDRGVLGEEVVVDPRVCECCATSAVALDAGTAFVTYRDRSGDEIRDIFGSRLERGAWTRPERCHEDGWEMPG